MSEFLLAPITEEEETEIKLGEPLIREEKTAFIDPLFTRQRFSDFSEEFPSEESSSDVSSLGSQALEDKILKQLDQLAVIPFQSGRAFNVQKIEDEILRGVRERTFAQTEDPQVPIPELEDLGFIEEEKLFKNAITNLITEINELPREVLENSRLTEEKIDDIESELSQEENKFKLIKKIQETYSEIFTAQESENDELQQILDIELPEIEIRESNLHDLLRQAVTVSREITGRETDRILAQFEGKEEDGEDLNEREEAVRQFLETDDILISSDVGVLKTFLQGVRSAQSKIKNPEVLNRLASDLISDIIDLDRIQISSVKLESQIPDLFIDEVNTLRSQSLTPIESDRINKMFAQELKEVIDVQIKTGVDPRRSHQEMLQYVNDHVANPTLKELMLNTVNRSIAQSGLLVRIDQPLIQKSFVGLQPRRMESTIGSDILATISPRIAQFRELNERKVPISDTVNHLIDEVNDKLKNNGVSKKTRSGSLELINIRKSGSVKARLDRIEKVFVGLSDPRSTFFRTPITTVRDIQESSNIVRDIKSAIRSQPRKKRDMKIKAPHSFKTMGRIKIFHDRNNNVSEILIPHTSKIQDLLKLAHILSIENGLIEDTNDNILLTVKRGITSESQILKIIQEQFKKHSGHDFRLIFKPKSRVGGLFLKSLLPVIANKSLKNEHIGSGLKNHILDSSLISMTHYGKHPAIQNMRGGSIKASDIFGGISGVAGAASAFPLLTPFTAPLALATGVAGGIARLFGAGFNASNLKRRFVLPQRITEHISVR